MKIKSLLGVLFTLITLTSQAQTSSIENISKRNLRNTGEIIKDNKIVGYYAFYKLDKADKKYNNYSLLIFDENLNEIARKNLKESKFISLSESAYNGDELSFKFFDFKEKEIKYLNYLTSGEASKRKTIALSKEEQRFLPLTFSTGDKDLAKKFYYPVQGGFLNYQASKLKKYSYKIDFFPTDDSKAWTFSAKEDAKKNITGEFLGKNENILLTRVTKIKGLWSYNLNYEISALDLKTGKEIFSTLLQNELYSIQPLNARINEKNETTIMGLYFDKNANSGKAKNLGIVLQVLNDKGEVVKEKYNSWEKDMTKFYDSNLKGKIKDIGFLHFHEMLLNDKGEIFAIAEEYKKVANAVGIASALLGSDASGAVDMKIDDLHFLKFNKDLEVVDSKVIEKSKSKVNLQNLSYVKGPLIAKYLDLLGYFDYAYTESYDDNNSFTTCYIDFDSEDVKIKDRSTYLGIINYKNGEYKTDRITLYEKRSKEGKIDIFRGKPGYVVVKQYDAKEKTLTLRLEKIGL